MTNKIIQEQGVAEVLLIDGDNCITEGSRSNVFFIRDNVFYTAPLPHVLAGNQSETGIKYLSGKRADRGGTKSELQGHSHPIRQPL